MNEIEIARAANETENSFVDYNRFNDFPWRSVAGSSAMSSATKSHATLKSDRLSYLASPLPQNLISDQSLNNDMQFNPVDDNYLNNDVSMGNEDMLFGLNVEQNDDSSDRSISDKGRVQFHEYLIKMGNGKPMVQFSELNVSSKDMAADAFTLLLGKKSTNIDP